MQFSQMVLFKFWEILKKNSSICIGSNLAVYLFILRPFHPIKETQFFLYQNRIMQIRSLSETPNFVRKAITLQQIDIFGNF